MKKILSLFSAAVLLIGMSACQSETPELPSGTAAIPPVVEAEQPEALAFDDYEGRQKLWEDYPIAEETEGVLRGFSARTAAELLQESENGCYSPISLYYALALSSSGAAGETKEQILSLLGFENAEALSLQCRNLYRNVYFSNEFGSLQMAASLWMSQNADFKAPFTETARESYYASLYKADFSDSATAQAISLWVKEQTHGLITPQIKTDPDQLLSILSTVYLKDEWTSAFSESATRAAPFHCADGDDVTADFMHRSDMGTFVRGKNYLSAQLNTKNNIQMVFFLPDEGINISELLTEESLAQLLSEHQGTYGEIEWSIPKFSFGCRYDLAESLQKLGMTNAFSMEKADFSPMTDETIFLDSAIQEAHIAIDENGLEAGAYTELCYAGAGMPQDRAEMNLNRPFIFAVIKSGVPLFIGVCSNPTM